MGKKKNKTENRNLYHNLRDAAEEWLTRSPAASPEMKEKNLKEVIHELQVHQIELEMQNDELRKTQLALEESRQRYADLYDFAPVGYFTFTTEALIKEVNLTGATLLGMVRQKLINARFRRMVEAKDRDRWDQHFQSVLKHEEKQTCELMLKRQDGSTFYAGLESIRMEVSRGAFEVHTTVTDITARKQAEEGLRLHEALYNGFINSMNSGVAVYKGNEDGSDFVFVDFNKAGEKIDKVKKEDLLGKSVLEMFPKIKEFGLFEIFQRVWKTGRPERHLDAFYLDQRIGGWRENYVYKLPSGEIVALYDDITERVQAEMFLRESEEKYRSLASTADLMYLVDRKCRYLFTNEKYSGRLDLRGTQIIGRMYSEFHSEEDTKEFTQKVKEVFDTNKSIQSEHKSERDQRYFLRTYSPVKDQDGKAIMAVTVVSKDITERKRAEEELRKSAQLLSSTGEMAKVGGWELDLSTQEVSWTEEVGRIHGVEPGYRPKLEEALNFYAPKSRPAVEEALRKAAETGEPYDLESLFIPSGSKDRIWVRSLGRAVYSGDKIVKLTGTFQNIDKYKKAEEALRKSEEKLSNLFDNAVEGVFQATPEGRLITANRAFARMFGYESPEEIINTVTDIAHQMYVNPADREMMIGILKKMGYLKNFECQMRQKDGRIFWGSINSRFTITVDGIPCFEGFLIDITERKKLEEDIRQSEERYRTIIEEIEEGYYEVDLAGNFTFVNDAMTRQLQYSRGELIGMNYRTYTPREEVEGVYKTFNRAYRTGEIIKWYPVTNIRKDGTPLFLEDSISCRRDKEGRIIGFRGISLDITERQRGEEAIKVSLTKYQTLFESLPLGVTISDKAGNIVEINKTAERLLGLPREEHTKRTIDSREWRIIRPDGSPMPAEEYASVRALKQHRLVENVEMGIVKEEGEVTWLNVTAAPIFLKDYGVVITYADITGRKQVEKEIEDLARFPQEDPNPVLRVEPDGLIIYANEASKPLLFDWNTEVGNYLPTSLCKRVVDTVAGKTRITMDISCGELVFLIVFLPILGNGYVNIYGLDITERKRAEEELRIYQKELQALAIKMTEVEETERKEIARTLHDLVGQNLTALNLNLNIILEMMTEDQKSLLFTRLEDSQKLLEETTRYIREVMSDLRPSVLDDFGLLAALHWYGQRFQGRTGIQINIEGEEFYPRLSSVMETIIFRITQEALTNVFKHASAREVNLRLEKVEDRVRLTITDDGQGFSFKGFRFGGEKRGWGIATMKERAVALRGDLQILTEPGKGTRVILQLPVEG